MKPFDSLRSVLAVMVFLSFAFSVFGESALTDPSIPDGEWSVLSILEDDASSTLRGRVEIRGNRRQYYDIFTESEDEKLELSLYRDSMTAFSVRTIRDLSGYRIESTTVVEGLPSVDGDEIRILDTTGLVYALRGYPFTDPKELRITFLSGGDNDNSDFELSVDLAEEENLRINGRSISCYRLELSFEMSGIFSVFMKMVPKTKLWYSKESPHYLVRYEGQNGPPGTPMTVMELVDYSGWN